LPRPPSPHSFFSPLVDFMMVGGATFLIFPLLLLTSLDARSLIFFSITAYALSFVINAPHFMFSYQLIYRNFAAKISRPDSAWSQARYILSGIIVPLILLIIFSSAFLSENIKILGYTVNFMFFLVGWHYVKQGYGILMACSAKKKVFFNKNYEKYWLLINGYCVWGATWVLTNGMMGRENIYNVPIAFIEFPAWVVVLFGVLAAISSAGALFFFVKRMITHEISWNGTVGYFCALYAWTALVIINPIFILIIPQLHSLQYLLFVLKLANNRANSEGRNATDAARAYILFLTIGGLLGVCGFWFAPYILDNIVNYDKQVLGASVFLLMFVVFINIHHYFIDFAIWRRDNPDMKYLYK